jgi:enoyl-CoA hydratase/carnithine racemase
VVAAVTGYALGGGLELALCADFRVAGEGARLGQPEILLGIIPGAGGTQRLPRLVGPARAKDIIYTGRFVPAVEAREIGLVDKVVPDGEVYQAARDMAARYAAGRTLRGRPRAGAAGRQAGDRRRPGCRPGHRPGDRAAALLGPVRDRGPARRNA